MLRIDLALWWEASGERPRALDPLLLGLLEGVARTGSLQQAARELEVSYRHAWGVVGDWARTLGSPLLHAERGRGAKLAPLGERLLRAESAARALVQEHAARLQARLAREFPTPARATGLRIEASHDLALARLRELAAPALDLDLRFCGSLDALGALSDGRCDLAGFHVAEGSPPPDALARLMGGRRLVRFVRRIQGLMVARGNPRRVAGLGDLVRTGIRFVNRQRGSGTRLLLDALLAEARLDPRRIHGYDNEEFTHAAVAATVASGMADAGFGIEAAARRAGLEFIELATERYFLACRPETLRTQGVRSLLALLRSPAFRRELKALPGYDAVRSGELVRTGAAPAR